MFLRKPTVIAFLLIFLITTPASAYRPYETFDASVNTVNQFEAQIGVFDISKEGAVSTITTPTWNCSYGPIKNIDFGFEGQLQVYTSDNSRNVELIEPIVYVDYQLRRGVLMGETGPSIMLEWDLILPSTVRGQRDVGFDSYIAASYVYKDIATHVNAGLVFDQINFNAGFNWGVIVEYPFTAPFRVGVDFNGTTTYSQKPEIVGTVAAIWTVGFAAFDVAARMGLTDASQDWEITTGVTLTFG